MSRLEQRPSKLRALPVLLASSTAYVIGFLYGVGRAEEFSHPFVSPLFALFSDVGFLAFFALSFLIPLLIAVVANWLFRRRFVALTTASVSSFIASSFLWREISYRLME